MPIYRAGKALDVEKLEIVNGYVNGAISKNSRHFFRYLSNVGKVIPISEFATISCILGLDPHLRDTQSLDPRSLERVPAVDTSVLWPEVVNSPILHLFTHL